jgi:hypothetical protein
MIQWDEKALGVLSGAIIQLVWGLRVRFNAL